LAARERYSGRFYVPCGLKFHRRQIKRPRADVLGVFAALIESETFITLPRIPRICNSHRSGQWPQSSWCGKHSQPHRRGRR
jgi:hypothetical protein